MRSPADFPRVELAHKPTPLEFMPNLTRLLGGPKLYVKRDDCTGLAMGGNKARKLEFYFGEAVARGADTVVITGAVQSNYVRSAAAAAAKLGLACEAQLEERVAGMGSEYQHSGNALLDELLGARIHRYPVGEDEEGADRSLEAIAARVESEGGRPYVIHLGPDHPPLGALGYVEAAGEILDQCSTQGIGLTDMVTASGSASTQAGLLVGLAVEGRGDIDVHGICVRRSREHQLDRLKKVVQHTATLLQFPQGVHDDRLVVHDDYLGGAYGHMSEGTGEALLLAARTEGLILDPVYAGKAFAGLLGLVREGELDPRGEVIFLHTGGTPALFAYGGEIRKGHLLR